MTPTPLFPVEKQNKLLRVHKDKQHIRDLLLRVVPHEEKGNTMSVSKHPFKFFFRPNNYRLKIPFSNLKNTKQEIKGVVGRFPVELCNYGSKGFLKNFRENITLEINPTCVVAIYSLKKKGKKAWLEVSCENLDEFDFWIDKKEAWIEEQCLKAVNVLGLNLDYDEKVWVRQEAGVKGEEFINSLPRDMIIQDTYFKKVYAEEVEFKSSFYVKNFIANRSIEKISPAIALELNKIYNSLAFSNPFDYVKTNYQGVEDILPGGNLFIFWNRLEPEEKNLLVNELW